MEICSVYPLAMSSPSHCVSAYLTAVLEAMSSEGPGRKQKDQEGFKFLDNKCVLLPLDVFGGGR